MGEKAALFLFLAATVVAVFAFLSVAVWVSAPSRERWQRDKLALLKTLAEQPGENAVRVLEMLREQDRIKEERRLAEERKGYLMGGLITIPVGLVLVKVIGIFGYIPLAVGVVLLGFGVFSGLQARRPVR